jgi:hypothetical protein
MRRLTFALLLACGPVDVVVADVPGMPPGLLCTGSTECGPGRFCERAACTDSFGICHDIPPVSQCQTQPTFDTCDCSGAHYPNDCLRQRAGASHGPC